MGRTGSSSPRVEDLSGNAVSSLRGRTGTEKSLWAQGSGEVGSWAPEASEGHTPVRVALPSPLWGGGPTVF